MSEPRDQLINDMDATVFKERASLSGPRLQVAMSKLASLLRERLEPDLRPFVELALAQLENGASSPEVQRAVELLRGRAEGTSDKPYVERFPEEVLLTALLPDAIVDQPTLSHVIWWTSESGVSETSIREVLSGIASATRS